MAGLGHYGRNSLIINKNYGSYMHLRSVVTDIPPELLNTKDDSASIMSNSCGKCHRCMEVCPTGAILENGLIDQSICLRNVMSGNLVQDREMSFKLLSKLNNRIMGCDECQKCCPANFKTKTAPEEIPDELIKLLDLKTLLNIDDAAYKAHLIKIADLIGPNVARPRRIKLNAAIAACNYHGDNLNFTDELRQFLNSRYAKGINPIYIDFINQAIKAKS
jgi:epoxyqueuosine reductase QueG